MVTNEETPTSLQSPIFLSLPSREIPCHPAFLKNASSAWCTFTDIFILFFVNFILFFNFIILYWFCHISKWTRHKYTCVLHPELSSLLPPHTIPLGRPSALAPSIQYHASNLDWQLGFLLVWFLCFCTSCQSRFDARCWMLGAGALGRPRGMVWGGRREESSGWGTHVYLWWIHFDIWQN